MKRIAIYPGSFDPITNGHLDILTRACLLFDEIILAIGVNNEKTSTFTIQERINMCQQAVAHLTNVKVQAFNSLSVNFAKVNNAIAIIRGLRVINDFEKEFQMALMNESLNHEIETVFLMARKDHTFISSSLIKELASYQQDVAHLVPSVVNKYLIDKYSLNQK